MKFVACEGHHTVRKMKFPDSLYGVSCLTGQLVIICKILRFYVATNPFYTVFVSVFNIQSGQKDMQTIHNV